MRRAERDDETDAIFRPEFGRARYKLVRAMRRTRLLLAVGWAGLVVCAAGAALAVSIPGLRVAGVVGLVVTCVG